MLWRIHTYLLGVALFGAALSEPVLAADFAVDGSTIIGEVNGVNFSWSEGDGAEAIAEVGSITGVQRVTDTMVIGVVNGVNAAIARGAGARAVARVASVGPN